MKKINFNNLRIRTKLLLIYAFCVLIPIIVTDATILYTVNENSKKNEMRDLSHVIDRIDYNLNDIFDRCNLFTYELYTDPVLNDFLNKEYTDMLDYYQNYTDILRNNILSYNYKYGVQSIQVCADNNTLLNGGRISTLDRVVNTEWYKAFKESGLGIFIYVYFDESRSLTPGSGPSRTISIIRKLNNFDNKGMEKLVKVDFDYNLIQKIILNEKIDGEIYITNKDYILFSNLIGDNGMKNFFPAARVDMEKVTITKDITAADQDWMIIIQNKQTAFWNVIFKYNGIILLVLLNIVLPTVLIYFVGRSISKRLTIVSAYMGKVKKEQFVAINCQEGDDEIGKLIRSYNIMVLKIKDLIEIVYKGNAEKQALELSKKQAELKAIQSQVNPHFLFNTLETIRMRSLLKNENETADIIGELAILFRKSMEWSSDYITIEEEMNFVEKYINIQKYRFGDRIKYYHYVMKDCKKYKVPKLSIVTFIENAFIHGIETTVKEGVVSVTITKNTEHLFIEISDNGKGVDACRLQEIKEMITNADSNRLYETKSTGMLNAYLRMKMYCDGRIQFDMDSALEKGTDITIQMPLQYVDGILGHNSKRNGEVTTDD